MPVGPCTTEYGDPGRRWGNTGTCYPCSLRPDGTWDCADAHRRAAAQGAAIVAAGYEGESGDE